MLIQSEISASPDTAFDSLVKVVTILGYSIKKTDPSTRTIKVRIPMHWQSYGEKLTFAIEPLDSGRSLLRVDARRAVPINLTSHPDKAARLIISYVEKECSGLAWVHQAKKTIPTKDIVTKSAGLILHNPVLILPALIFGLMDTLLARAADTLFGQVPSVPILTFHGIAIATIDSIIGGAFFAVAVAPYTPMVQALVSGVTLSVSRSVKDAIRRLPDLLIVGVIISLLFAAFDILSILALVLVYPVLWYMYTIPAMMSEPSGVWKGMKASKAFGRDKKSSTIYLYLEVGIPGALLAEGVPFLLSMASPLAGQVVGFLLDLPVLAWFAVTVSYTYLVYGPSASPGLLAPAGTPAEGSSPSNRFCSQCGAPLTPEARLCANCGKQVRSPKAQ
jgi:hypothetical protein